MEFTGPVIFLTAFLTMIASQVTKMALITLKNRKFNLKSLFELSGMPSSHTASATALTVSVYLAQGFSVLFAVLLMGLIYVISGVLFDKWSFGNHAKIINEVRQFLKEEGYKAKKHKQLMESHVREEWGHTPAEIVSGFILGLIVALVISAI